MEAPWLVLIALIAAVLLIFVVRLWSKNRIGGRARIRAFGVSAAVEQDTEKRRAYVMADIEGDENLQKGKAGVTAEMTKIKGNKNQQIIE